MAFLSRVTAKWAGARVAVTLLLLGAFICSPARAQDHREYSLKAVFLYNFCQFVDWPPGAFPSNNAPVVIGVYGGNPFGTLLHQTVAGEVVRGRRIEVRFLSRPEYARGCQIVFVTRSGMSAVPQILAAVQGQHVVTVGENEEFLDLGGMVALTESNNRVRLRINL